MGNSGFYGCLIQPTLVPQIFLDFSSHERAAREPRSGKYESRHDLCSVFRERRKIKKNLWDQGRFNLTSRCFSVVEGNSTYTYIRASSFLVAKSPKTQSGKA